ncbi:MAG: peptidylprolyl isomerase [Bacteroidetes bacterium]|nr:peptidylprolyl isomerase [Bacteroidota bacterium]
MKYKNFFLLFGLMVFFLPGFSGENDDVLIKINGKNITKAEFIAVYEKNNLYNQAIDPKSVEEYLELFINFNLKVFEAINNGLDTTESFINELNSYREQLAQPYLNDQVVTEALIKEAYERMKYHIRASHILKTVPEHAMPDDTLKTYRITQRIRERALRGDDFSFLAIENSDDPSAKGSAATANSPGAPGNRGDLGYFSAFSMVYPFETMAYATPVGEISEIVRSSFGFHIIKVTDKIPTLGQVRAAHIMISVPKNADEKIEKNAQDKINEIYNKLLQGEDFVGLVKQFSDDKGSAARDGDIPPFTANRMLPEVIKAIADMTQNDIYTKPFRTQFGWHVFKVHEKSGIASYEDMYPEIKARVARDLRSQISQDVVIEKLKSEYGFVENVKNIEPFFRLVTPEIFEANWNKDKLKNINEVLFSFANQKLTQQDFAKYLEDTQVKRTSESIVSYVNGKYLSFVNKSIIDYEKSILNEKYPDFKLIMQEYHDGILLFELTDKMVWSKAMNDTLGLREFFEKNRGNYMWDKRINATIYQTRDQKVAKKLRKEVVKANKKGLDFQVVIDKFNQNSLLNVSAASGFYEPKDHPAVSLVEWKVGVSQIVKFDDSFFVISINEILPQELKKLTEIRGLVIADYQNYLESLWINELRGKYNIVVNQKVLNEVKELYKN